MSYEHECDEPQGHVYGLLGMTVWSEVAIIDHACDVSELVTKALRWMHEELAAEHGSKWPTYRVRMNYC